MKFTSMARLCLLALPTFSGPAFAATLGSQTITVSSTPTALPCASQRYVNKLTIRVIPGFEGKIFVGTAAMNTSSYAGTLSILYPNGGAHSEEYTVRDLSGDDGIDLCGIYIAGGIPGENAIAEYLSNNGGKTAPTYLLVPSYVGTTPVTSVASTLLGNYFVGGNLTYYFQSLRVQIIPGYVGKETISTSGSTGSWPYTGLIQGNTAILYPNSGTQSQHNGWSEFYEVHDPLGANGMFVGCPPKDANNCWSGGRVPGYADYTVTPAVNGEEALLSIWQKQTANGSVEIPSVYWYHQSFELTASTACYQWSPSSSTQSIEQQARIVPGYTSKVYTNYKTTYGTLFPNNTGSLGWSESMSWGDNASFGGVAFCSDSNADVTVSWLTPGYYSAKPPTAISSFSSAGFSNLTPVIGGSSIGLGNVKHLRLQVTPGQTGKMFIGSSSMNISTLAGVYAVLYPNSTGRWSETLELDDPEGDGIPTNSLYVMSANAGEAVQISSVTTGVTPPDGVMSVKMGGPLLGSASSYGIAFQPSSTPFAILRAQAIPGNEGKLWIGGAAMTAAQPDSTYANVLKVLWPSEGNYNVGEGWSERYEQTCRTGPTSAPNCLDLNALKFWPYLSSEQLLVFALGR